jgi:hypothetical protein
MKLKAIIFSILFTLPSITLASNNSFFATVYCSTLGSWFGDSVCVEEIKPEITPAVTRVPSKEAVTSTTTTTTQIIKQYITQPTVIEKIVQVPSIDMSNYVTKEFLKNQAGRIGEVSGRSLTSALNDAPEIDTRVASYLSRNSVPALTAESLLADTAGSLDPTVVTDVVTMSDDSYYEYSQKSLAIASDGFARFVYFDNSRNDLHYVQCTDADCTTKNNTIVVSDNDEVTALSLVLDVNNLAHFTYLAGYSQLHHVRCTNASCSSSVDTLVDSADSVGLGSFYITSISLGSDGFARIVYDNYGDDTSKLRMAQCTDADCTTPVLTTMVTSGNYLEGSQVAMASDGFARVAYTDYSTTPEQIRYIQCTNASCSTNNNTLVDNSSSYYYIALVLGSDGFGRIAYQDEDNGLQFAQCTNASCSTKNLTQLVSSAYVEQTSIVMGTDDLPRISYSIGTDPGQEVYIRCTNASCSTKSSAVISSNTSGSLNSIALGNDGYARIIFVKSGDQIIQLARMKSESGQAAITGSTLGTDTSRFGTIYSSRINASELWAEGDSTGALRVTDSTGTEILKVNSITRDVDLINLTVSATTTLDGVVVSGNKRTYSVDRTVAGGAGDTVELGSVSSDFQGNAVFTIYLTDSTSGGSAAMTFEVVTSYDLNTSLWQELVPKSTTGVRGWSNIVVDIKKPGGGNGPLFLRLRGKTYSEGRASAIRAAIETYGDSEFFPSSTAGTSGTVSGLFTSTALTQNAGNVGIGTSSPQSKLELTQSANTSEGGFRLSSTDGDSRAMFMNTSGVLSFTGGDTGTINTATLNAAGAWTNASDRSYKENIVDLYTKYTLENIMKIEPRYYSMKGSGQKQIGFIAQELKVILPEVVEGEDGSMGISYGNMVALLVEGVKELAKMVYSLGHRVETEELCIGKTCITEAELQDLLQKNSVVPVVHNSKTVETATSNATTTQHVEDIQEIATTTDSLTITATTTPVILTEPEPVVSPIEISEPVAVTDLE